MPLRTRPHKLYQTLRVQWRARIRVIVEECECRETLCGARAQEFCPGPKLLIRIIMRRAASQPMEPDISEFQLVLRGQIGWIKCVRPAFVGPSTRSDVDLSTFYVVSKSVRKTSALRMDPR
jgi:hypothetical protein